MALVSCKFIVMLTVKFVHFGAQKLPERVLGKLGLEQSKIRYLPLHLHARQLTLPGTGEADISVSCPLPKYFTQTLNRLQLSLPKVKDHK